MSIEMFVVVDPYDLGEDAVHGVFSTEEGAAECLRDHPEWEIQTLPLDEEA